MSKDKEGSAVAALLNEINELRERVETLEIYTGAYMTRGMHRASDVMGYRGYYGDRGYYGEGPMSSPNRTNEVITLNNPPSRISAGDVNDTVPLADVRITDDGYTRTATYCASSHI